MPKITDPCSAQMYLAQTFPRGKWPVEAEDVELARTLIDEFSHLDARDLLHLACCRRRNVLRIKTLDRALAAAFA